MNVNEPAFPRPAGQSGYESSKSQDGMSVRDYFAAAALPACVTNLAYSDAREMAKWAYRVADAMLAERKLP